MSEARFFNGWAKPGPLVKGESEVPPELPAGESLDAISGDYRLFQLKAGHRFSTDDLLVAWYGALAVPRAERILELGSGIGTVGMIAAWKFPAARIVAIEAQEESVRLARKSARYNGLEDRYDLRHGDFRSTELGVDERFDLVLGSPPYFPLEAGLPGDHPQKIACRFEVRGDVSDYCKVAAARLAPGGVFACVFPVTPPHQRERVFAAARAAGLLVLRWRPVCFKQSEPPLLGVFAMMKPGDLPEVFRGSCPWEEGPLTIRRADGSVDAEYSRVKLSIGFPP